MWLEQAEVLDACGGQLAEECAEVVRATWRAGVDPEATRSLVTATLALGLEEPASLLRGTATGEPMPSDRVLVAEAAEIEGAVFDLTAVAGNLGDACDAAAAAAANGISAAIATERAELAAAAAADRLAAAARAAAARARSKGEASAAQSDASAHEAEAARHRAAAQAAAAERAAAEAELADCEAALEVLAGLLDRLGGALTHLPLVPDDLLETYETAYWLVRAGLDLPHDGDFLTIAH
jgi:hypothetical protein